MKEYNSEFQGSAILVHAIRKRMNIRMNKASKEREWTFEFQFKFELKGLIHTFRRFVFSSDYVGHRIAPISISVSQIPKLTTVLKKTIG